MITALLGGRRQGRRRGPDRRVAVQLAQAQRWQAAGACLVVTLLCLRPDHEGVAELRTSCVRRLLPLLTPGTRATLTRPEYVTQAPPSFNLSGEGTVHPVLTGDPEDPDLCFDEAATRGLTDAGRAALAELSEVAHRTYTGVLLGPGDLAVVDNRVTLHGRSAFTPRYDGQDRWLQRTFAFSDLRRSRDHRPGDGAVLVERAPGRADHAGHGCPRTSR